MDKIRRIMKLAHAPGSYYSDYTALMAETSLTVDLSEYNEELKEYDIIYAISAPMYEYEEEEAIIIANIIMNIIYKFKLQYLIPATINRDIRSVLTISSLSAL